MSLFLDSSSALPVPVEPLVHASADEVELVRRARTDANAFGTLYRRHYPAIARYVRRRIGDLHTANDLVAETFTTALEQLPRYRPQSDGGGLAFRAWLYRLASTRVNRWLRRRPLTSHTTLVEDLPEEHEEVSAEEREETERARRALLSLPARYQSTLALHYLEGLSVEEVARVLGCRPGTVKARLSRGRERMRRRLSSLAKEQP